ncbi:phytoene desaturase [Rhodobacterales bacterium HKCCE3408]|nr:phytoene desaturase [Rhodobacterales bacterium HKCCE3408]
MAAESGQIVVIGAGIGGLSAALRLAAAGHRVRVVEAAAAPGGKMRQVPSSAGPVDAGPTVLTMAPVFEDLFAAAGTTLSDHVTLVREPVLARHWWPDGSTLDLHDDAEASAEAVGAFAGPGEARAFRAFTLRARALFDGFDAPIMQAPKPTLSRLVAHVLAHPGLATKIAPGRSLAGLLRTSFRDPRLRQLFGRYATYVGGSPYLTPGLLCLIWASEAAGVWRVEGGMQRLAQAIADLAEARGVTFSYGQPVARVERQGGRASAVVLEDGARIACTAVLFNGDPRALSLGLLGDGIREAIPGTGTEPRSYSAYVWHFAAEADGLPLAHHNVIFGHDARSEFDDLEAGRMPADPTLYICAQDRGAGLHPEGRERFEIILNGPPGQSPPEEEFLRCRTLTFETLSAAGLRLSPRPGREALTTPGDFSEAFPGSAGSLYGRSPHGTMAAFQRPTARTAVPGLYLAGGGAHPGAGVPMACLSGRHAAAAMTADLASTSTSRRTAMPGGMSTGSPTTGPVRSRSSVS